jgi:uncharacterized membrane protein YraQ (UPF0718 family)/YHS domain-containing protein
VTTIWHSLEEGFFMLWQTLWALIVGFTLSGAVQAFVSRAQMQRVMGDHLPATVARTSLLGMASSSCSYAASALARTLFGRGADFTTAMVFMVASTNLVLELGLVLWLLIGWPFAAAEFVGGAIMVALLAVALPRAAPAAVTEPARRRVAADLPTADDEIAGSLRERFRDRGRWRAAARYTIADLTMLRREIVIGFVVAGFLAVAVPTGVWNSVFIHGHGAATSVENAVVGPAVAIVSFVCSIGNVPLAAALWAHGVSFGGVVAFVFADLLSLPLLLIYRKLYGGLLTLRLAATLWAVMSVSGLLTEVIFRTAGWVPGHRPTLIAPERFAWDHTTFLNIGFGLVFIALLAIRRTGAAAITAHATDPVCGMQVDRANPGATADLDAERLFFCSPHCRDRYLRGQADLAGRTS